MKHIRLLCLCSLLATLGMSEEVRANEVARAFVAASHDAEAHVCESLPYFALMVEAQTQAQLQADIDKQGHQHWSDRCRRLQLILGPGYTFNEICAETWERQSHLPFKGLADEFFRCWKQSKGHWRVAKASHLGYGCGMAQGRSGVWYGCIIVADKK